MEAVLNRFEIYKNSPNKSVYLSKSEDRLVGKGFSNNPIHCGDDHVWAHFVSLALPSVCVRAPPGLFTMTGLFVYIQYCNQAMEDFKVAVPPEKLATVDVSFGWSLAIAWLSYSLQVAAGLLLFVAARITQMKRHYDSGVAMF